MSSQDASGKSQPVPRTPRLERGKARVAALKAAGEAIFAERGYDAATMTEIAARAGASIGSLYQFFPTKALLAAALHAELLDRLSDRIDALAGPAAGRDAGAVGGLLWDALVDFLARHPALAVLADRRDADPAQKRAARARLRTQVTALLEAAAPPLAPGRAALLAVVVLQLLRAAVSLDLAEEAPTRDAALAELRGMLRHHLADPSRP